MGLTMARPSLHQKHSESVMLKDVSHKGYEPWELCILGTPPTLLLTWGDGRETT